MRYLYLFRIVQTSPSILSGCKPLNARIGSLPYFGFYVGRRHHSSYLQKSKKTTLLVTKMIKSI